MIDVEWSWRAPWWVLPVWLIAILIFVAVLIIVLDWMERNR